MAKEFWNIPTGRMLNEDGEIFEKQLLTWRLEVPLEVAVDALYSLTLKSKENALWNAKRDNDGTLLWAELTWIRLGKKKDGWNDLLGRITLEPGSIKAEVNSEGRATRLKIEVTKRLGDGVAFEKAVLIKNKGF